MNVELSIKDDKELRNCIKDMIRGEVLSVARKEIIDIIKDVVGKKTNIQFKFETLLNEVVKDRINSTVGGRCYQHDFIGKIFREEITKLAVKEFNKLKSN